MTDLSSLKAECKRDEARVDSLHGKIDKLSSSDKGSEANSSGLTSPASPSDQKSGPNIVALGLVVAVAVAVVLAALMITSNSATRSPEAVYREYVDASNDRDIKRMFDQTVTRFSDFYDEEKLTNLSEQIFFLDPQIEILDVEVLYKDNLSVMQDVAAQVIVADVEDSLSIDVTDYCYVEYTVNVEYRDIGQGGSFSGDMVCAMIDGHWYLVVPLYY
jgi:hypothetical protein